MTGLNLPSLIYFTSFVASCVCAALLVRSYWRTRSRLLLWSAACFVFLALNSLTVLADFVLFPNVDLAIVRAATLLAGISALLYGFIWEAD
jgi:hypothetical protein